jgi:hypothetical protein
LEKHLDKKAAKIGMAIAFWYLSQTFSHESFFAYAIAFVAVFFCPALVGARAQSSFKFIGKFGLSW